MDETTMAEPRGWMRVLAGTGKVSDALAAETPRTLSRKTEAELDTLGLTEAQRERVAAMLAFAREAATETLTRGAIFRAADDIFRHYHATMRDLRVEQFRAILLDGKHRVLGEVMISQGTLTSSPVHPHEVFAPAIARSAAAIVLVHNHPSGDPSPSSDDLDITRRLCEVGQLVGIRVLDHVVIGDGSFVSMADRGLIGR